MPTKVIRWACSLCDCEFDSVDLAEECEDGEVADQGYQLGDLFVVKNELEGILIGWWRDSPKPLPISKAPIHKIIAGRLVRNSNSIRGTHRLVYLLQDENGEVDEATSPQLGLGNGFYQRYVKLVPWGEETLVNVMLDEFRSRNRTVLPEVTPVAEKFAQRLLKKAFPAS